MHLTVIDPSTVEREIRHVELPIGLEALGEWMEPTDLSVLMSSGTLMSVWKMRSERVRIDFDPSTWDVLTWVRYNKMDTTVADGFGLESLLEQLAPVADEEAEALSEIA